MILQIDVTVTSPDGTTASGSVAVDVEEPSAGPAPAADVNEALRQRSLRERGMGRA